MWSTRVLGSLTFAPLQQPLLSCDPTHGLLAVSTCGYVVRVARMQDGESAGCGLRVVWVRRLAERAVLLRLVGKDRPMLLVVTAAGSLFAWDAEDDMAEVRASKRMRRGEGEGSAQLPERTSLCATHAVETAHLSSHGVLLCRTAAPALLVPWAALDAAGPSGPPPLELLGEARLVCVEAVANREWPRAPTEEAAARAPPHLLEPDFFHAVCGGASTGLLLADERGALRCLAGAAAGGALRTDGTRLVAMLGEPPAAVLLISRGEARGVDMVALVGQRGGVLLLSAAEGGGLSREMWQQPVAGVCAACALPGGKLVLAAADGVHLIDLPPRHGPDRRATAVAAAGGAATGGVPSLASQLLGIAGHLACVELATRRAAGDPLRVVVLCASGVLRYIVLTPPSKELTPSEKSRGGAQCGCEEALALAATDYSGTYDEWRVRECLRQIGEGSAALSTAQQQLFREEEALREINLARQTMHALRSSQPRLKIVEDGRILAEVHNSSELALSEGWSLSAVLMLRNPLLHSDQGSGLGTMRCSSCSVPLCGLPAGARWQVKLPLSLSLWQADAVISLLLHFESHCQGEGTEGPVDRPPQSSACAFLGVHHIGPLHLLRPRCQGPTYPRPPTSAILPFLLVNRAIRSANPKVPERDTQCKLWVLLASCDALNERLTMLVDGASTSVARSGELLPPSRGIKHEAVFAELPDGKLVNLQLSLSTSGSTVQPPSCGAQLLLRMDDCRRARVALAACSRETTAPNE
ncbi:hypothetical protein AB1Y20_001301 [Prymnesium parvum]|uniref:Anaphase-promoting complex subunit 1 n=1 Tax=Prymnesium parvum TaxID=97485 RepID=A0AB34KD65_PRYPA